MNLGDVYTTCKRFEVCVKKKIDKRHLSKALFLPKLRVTPHPLRLAVNEFLPEKAKFLIVFQICCEKIILCCEMMARPRGSFQSIILYYKIKKK